MVSEEVMKREKLLNKLKKYSKFSKYAYFGLFMLSTSFILVFILIPLPIWMFFRVNLYLNLYYLIYGSTQIVLYFLLVKESHKLLKLKTYTHQKVLINTSNSKNSGNLQFNYKNISIYKTLKAKIYYFVNSSLIILTTIFYFMYYSILNLSEAILLSLFLMITLITQYYMSKFFDLNGLGKILRILVYPNQINSITQFVKIAKNLYDHLESKDNEMSVTNKEEFESKLIRFFLEYSQKSDNFNKIDLITELKDLYLKDKEDSYDLLIKFETILNIKFSYRQFTSRDRFIKNVKVFLGNIKYQSIIFPILTFIYYLLRLILLIF
jgi:hypothetical protein